jgi:hypothetical protein
VTTPASPSRGLDPEAEQEVDFARYVRLLAIRWWLLAAGLVAGAIIGYLISLGGGNQVYSATAVVYLGQPTTPTGNGAVITPATNPSAVSTAVGSPAVQNTVANECNTSVSKFAKGISTAAIATGAATKSGAAAVNPFVKVSVQAKKGKIAACAANKLAAAAVKRIGVYPAATIKNLEAQIAADQTDIKAIQAAIANPNISDTNKLLLGTFLRSDQLDKTTNSQLLLLAKNVASPSVYTPAASRKVTARSRRNTVVIAALIGLILGALAALLWDTVVPRLTPRNGD